MIISKMNLNDWSRKKYSQGGEDGVTQKIFELIGTTNKVAVEIGVQKGDECCSRILWEIEGWGKILFDDCHSDTTRNLRQVRVTPQNVLDLFIQSHVPMEPDFLGVDIDGQDFYVVHTILRKYKPRVLVVETNPTWGTEDKVVYWDHPIEEYWSYHGASLAAWHASLNPHYHLVCHEKGGINAFFVRAGLIDPGVISNYNELGLYCAHEGNLDNYRPYPADYPVLSSKEALELLNATI